MGVALPWKWFTWLFSLSESRAQAISYLSSPLFALIAVWVIHFLLPQSFCLFQHFLHIPCPGCGITSSVFAVLSGNYTAAWKYNPCGFLVVTALLGQSLVSSLELLSIVSSGARMTLALQSNTILTICLLSIWLVRLSTTT